MLTYRDLIAGLKGLQLEPPWPLLVQASMPSLGEVRGGADTLLGALLATSDHLMMPAFTYRTMVIPETGPERNGITYGSGAKSNALAEFFWPDMAADQNLGEMAEKLRKHPHATRSQHPILSFSGINAEDYLSAQTLEYPLAPVVEMARAGGWELLIGMDARASIAIETGIWKAGRKTFTRWALTPAGIAACNNFPGCPDGFTQAVPEIEAVTRKTRLGEAEILAFRMEDLFKAVRELVDRDPLALLCDKPDCERCQSVREAAG